MEKITQEAFQAKKNCEPRRRCFRSHPGVQENKQPGATPSFSVKFNESIGLVFKSMTGKRLRYGEKHNNYYTFLDSEEEIAAAKEWEASQGSRLFLRDCLTCSIALDTNFIDNENLEYTELGKLEHDAKIGRNMDAVEALVSLMVEAIRSLPPYGRAQYVAAVPPRPGKDYDLPSLLAERIADELELTDITQHFVFGGEKDQVKNKAVEEKWEAWNEAELGLNFDLTGAEVLLIDDKYQSGATANHVAMVLQVCGAAEVYGLFAVKTLRDTDNR